MHTTLLIILTIISLIITLWLFDLTIVVALKGAPFVLTPYEVLEPINAAFDVDSESQIYELGCGDARVLTSIAASKKVGTYIGIDRSFTAYLLAKLRVLRCGGVSNITIRRGNIFDEDLSNATHIFLWILPNMMAKLLPKLQHELKQSATVVSMDFEFPGILPDRVIPLNYPRKKYAKNLNIYTVRPR